MHRLFGHKESVVLPLAVMALSFSAVAGTTNKRPNILFAMSDDQSFAHTSLAGCKFVKTPAFDRVAKEGIYFKNCIDGSERLKRKISWRMSRSRSLKTRS